MMRQTKEVVHVRACFLDSSSEHLPHGTERVGADTSYVSRMLKYEYKLFRYT